MIVAPSAVTLKDGTAVTLRSPTAADAAAVLTYARALMHESSRNMNHFPAFFDGLSVEAEAAILGQFAEAPRGFMISAFLPGGEVAGNIGVTVDARGRVAHVGKIGNRLVYARPETSSPSRSPSAEGREYAHERA